MATTARCSPWAPPSALSRARRGLALALAALAVTGCATPLLSPAPSPTPVIALVSPMAPERTPSNPKQAATPAPPAGLPVPSKFRAGDHGADLSYPQCAAGDRLPDGARFAVIGINAGRAFTVNPCLRTQLREAAPVQRSVYVNSGYTADNRHRVGRACRSLSARLDAATEAERDAYAIGCQEGEYAVAALRAAGSITPVTWWIDVEATNSWDEVDLNLNRFALEGLIDRLSAQGAPVGVYSTAKEWQEVTGGWQAVRVAADWVVGNDIRRSCGAPGFSGAPVWLVQEADTTWPSGLDSDWAC